MLGLRRMGFHLPPFSSVPHLHLHVLFPASEMNSRSLSRYGPQSYWFITVGGSQLFTPQITHLESSFFSSCINRVYYTIIYLSPPPSLPLPLYLSLSLSFLSLLSLSVHPFISLSPSLPPTLSISLYI